MFHPGSAAQGPETRANRGEIAGHVSQHTLGEAAERHFQGSFCTFETPLHLNSKASVDKCAVINFSSVSIY